MLAAPPQELAYETNLVHKQLAGRKTPRPRAQNRARQKVVLLGLVLLAIGIAFGKTYLAVQLVIKGYELDALKQEINTMQRENERLQLEVARLKAPERIAAVATTRLGMVEPRAGQLYYVPGKAGQGQQLQVATGEPAGKGVETTAPVQQSWLAALSRALQNWLDPVRLARVNS
ncbi:Cell division protein FtsL [Neomoorella glycerini]|uniref:Cell division protein FtsL n=1 Tax=Neomoorella glycerini TaxID=55779 RepID=A0A6I5ZTQ7_9FIRM|nr:cell division protein FtsL [Moorella glycerini]QGP92917.1 Cell division protein FtsL [Moorella glycerini]